MCRCMASLDCLVVDTARGWKLATPDVNGINHQTHIQAAGPSARFGRGNQMPGNVPLAVSQVCQVTFRFSPGFLEGRDRARPQRGLLSRGKRTGPLPAGAQAVG